MIAHSMSTHLQRAAVGLAHSGRLAGARLKTLSWRHRPPRIDELLICPIDVRTADPTFAEELAAGHLGLAGEVLDLNGRSPFSLKEPSEAFARALHSFEWLRHLDAVRTIEAEQIARIHVGAWIARFGHRPKGLPWNPVLTARRMLSWLAHAPLIVTSDDEDQYYAVMRSLGRQLAYLSRMWSTLRIAEQRATVLIAITVGHLCRRNGEPFAHRAAGKLMAQLDLQILGDGGHVSRNPETALELLLDLHVLKQCYAERSIEIPASISETIAKLRGFLRVVRLGDGTLSSFNGTTLAARDSLAIADSLERIPYLGTAMAQDSGYCRLTGGDGVVIIDAGEVPAQDFAVSATASALAFDMTAAGVRIIQGSYRPSLANESGLLRARSTTGYSALVLGDEGYAAVAAHPSKPEAGIYRLTDATTVKGKITEGDGTCTFDGTHDGYGPRFNVSYSRRLELASDGRTLTGVESFAPQNADAAIKPGLPFAVHFHVSPDCLVRHTTAPGTIEILLPNGASWQLSSADATVSIEESRAHAVASGPLSACQIVLRGPVVAGTAIRWTLSEVNPGQSMSEASLMAVPRRKLSERLAEAIAEVNAAEDKTAAQD